MMTVRSDSRSGGKSKRENHPIEARELLCVPPPLKHQSDASSADASRRKARKKAPNTPSALDESPDEQRERMIAEAAYYRAERRGFEPGNELIDWLEAEQEIDAMLNEPYETADAPAV